MGKIWYYINGEERSRMPDFGAIAPLQGLYLCHWPFWGTELHQFVGLIDEFRVWDHVRTPLEILEGMNHALPSFTTPGLMVYYDFNQQVSNETREILDQSGNDIHLVLGGCVPNSPPYCQEGLCNTEDTPRYPCVYNVDDDDLEDLKKKRQGSFQDVSIDVVESLAPIGGYQSSFEADYSEEIMIEFEITEVDGLLPQVNLLQSPVRGIVTLIDDQVAALEPGLLPLNTKQVKFLPGDYRGGQQFSSLFYSTFDSKTQSYSFVNVTFDISIRCPPGTYLSELDFTCTLCPVGTYSPFFGYKTSCQLCPPSTYQNYTGSTECSACPPQTFTQEEEMGREYCRLCEETPPEESVEYGCEITPYYTQVTEGKGLVFTILTLIMIFITIIFFIIIFYFRKTPIIRAIGPVFCLLLLFGIMISFSTYFVFSGEVTDFKCAFRPWLVIIVCLRLARKSSSSLYFLLFFLIAHFT
eukprot:Lithocolla_globosa_v1_NODE_74_length_6885_cov_10.215813.p3 type:complete len:468 gc:universal NODE_74_length_6885_cov_10.215813:1549-146(-)